MRIVLVHDDPQFVAKDVAAYNSSFAALDALKAAQTVDQFITPVASPHGVSLVMMAKRKKPNLR